MTSMALSTSSRVTSRVFSWVIVRVTCLPPPSRRGLDGACNILPVFADLRVKGRHRPVKKKFRLLALAAGPKIRTGSPDERAADKTGYDRRRVLGQAKVQVPHVTETL